MDISDILLAWNLSQRDYRLLDKEEMASLVSMSDGMGSIGLVLGVILAAVLGTRAGSRAVSAVLIVPISLTFCAAGMFLGETAYVATKASISCVLPSTAKTEAVEAFQGRMMDTYGMAVSEESADAVLNNMETYRHTMTVDDHGQERELTLLLDEESGKVLLLSRNTVVLPLGKQ